MSGIKFRASFLKKFSSDFLYTVSAVVVLNIVQQMVIQPYVNRVMGAEYLGNMLYYLGITYVFPQMFGVVLGHQRILYKHNEHVTNGDFLTILGGYSIIAFFIGGIDAYMRTKDIPFAFGIAIFMFICTLRYYGQVEFRLNLFFKGYLIYFLILSAGYLLGLIPFQFVHQWIYIFIFGEIAAVVFVLVRGSVFRPTKPSPMLKRLWLPTTLLVLSYLLSSTSYLDRVVIKTTLGDLAVSQYYAVSLFSKIINMLVQPLATLILSYLADRKTSGFNLRLFQKTTVCCLGMCVVLTAGCCIGTPIAVRILYPNLMDVVPALNLPVNIGSVLGFAGQLMLVFLLAEASLNYQLLIRGVCFVVYLGCTFGLTIQYGLMGYVYAAIVSNGFCFAFAVACGIHFFKKKERLRLSVKKKQLEPERDKDI